VERCGLDGYGSGYGAMLGPCEHGNEPVIYTCRGVIFGSLVGRESRFRKMWGIS
jgi:hypothetical protein